VRTYILRRVLLIVPIMLGVSFFTFLTIRIVPGDIAQLRCGIACTPEAVAALRHDVGLDRPWYEQYGDWSWVSSAAISAALWAKAAFPSPPSSSIMTAWR